MSKRNYSNTAVPQVLGAGVNDSALNLTVPSTAGYPPPPFLLGLERGTANEEVVLCTATTATTFTIQRGYDGTSPKAHAVGTLVEHTVAAIDYREAGTSRLTTAERDALTGADLWEGRVIFNTDLDEVQAYDGARWGFNVGQISERVSTATVAAVTTLDLTQGMTHSVSLNQNISLAISNLPAGRASGVTVILKQDATGGRTVAWPAGTRWPDGVAPVLGTAANAVNIVTLLNPDGGATWYGFLAGRNMA
jgi:asparagine N-glycosylation enzyme membrane subunit Stt3